MKQIEYESLVERCAAGAWRAAARASQSEAAASDAVQDVFARLLDGRLSAQRLRDLQASCGSDETALRILVVKAALNARRSEGRRVKRERDHAMNETTSSSPAAGEVASHAEALRLVSNAVSELPESLRAIVSLRFEEGLSFASIGSAIGASESTAHDQLGRALARLRSMLVGAGLGGTGLGVLAATPGSLGRLIKAWGQDTPPLDPPAGLVSELVALDGTAGPSGASAMATAAAGPSSLGLFAGAAAALVATILSGALMAQGSAGSDSQGQPTTPAIAEAEPGPAGDSPSILQDVQVAAGGRELGGAVLTTPVAAASKPFVLTGRVVDGGGSGVVAATVRVSTVERSGKRPLWSLSVVAGQDGTFGLEVPFDGELEGASDAELIVDAGHLGYLHLGKSRVRAVPGGAQSIELGLALPAGERAGDFTLDVLVRGPAGEPLPGTLVVLSHVTPRERASVGSDVRFSRWSALGHWLRLEDGKGRTDSDGRLRISGKRLGAKTLWVEPTGNFAPLRQSLAVTADGDQGYDVQVNAGERVTGTLIWADEGPMRAEELKGLKASVVLEPDRWRTVPIQPDGTFAVEGLGKAAYVLRVGPGRGWPPKLGERPSRGRLGVTPGGGPMNIRLKRRSDPRDIGLHDVELHGDAVDAATGESIALAPSDLFSWPLWDLPAGDLELDVFPNVFRAPPVQRAIGSGGEMVGIHEDGLDPGAYMVQVSSPAHGLGVIGPLVARDGEVRSGLRVRVGEPGAVEPSVVDEAGRPVQGAWVFVTGLGPYSDSVVASVDEGYRGVDKEGPFSRNGGRRTDALGKARLGRLPHGMKVTIAAVLPGFLPGRSASVEIVAGETAQVGLVMAR